MKSIRVGTRASDLARWQSQTVIRLLSERYPELEIEEVLVTTKGDKILDRPFAQIPGKGLFTKELEDRMFAGEIDLAVHSLKDLPTELPPGLTIAAILERESPEDVLVGRTANTLAELPPNAVVGSASTRRIAQVHRVRRDLQATAIRGNVGTRLRKLDEGQCDALILANAGLIRLGLDNRITQVLSDHWYYAVGQGAVAVETRESNTWVNELFAPLTHQPTAVAVTAERALLHELDSGCRAPVGVRTELHGDQLTLNAIVASPDAESVVSGSICGPAARGKDLGIQLAAQLRSRGADKILQALDP